MRKAIGVTALVGVVLTQTACSSLVGESLFTGEDEGRILISADAEGMKAFGDFSNGLITSGKSSPDVPTSYQTQREHQEEQKTKRKLGQMFKKPKGGEHVQGS